MYHRLLVGAAALIVVVTLIGCGRSKAEPIPTSEPTVGAQATVTPFTPDPTDAELASRAIDAADVSASTSQPVPSSTSGPGSGRTTPGSSAMPGPPTAPVPNPTRSLTATATSQAPVPRRLPSEPPERDLHALAHKLGRVGQRSTPRTTDVGQVAQVVGHRESFFVTDLDSDMTRVIDATLLVVSPNVYWYVDDALELSTHDLNMAAKEYETNVRPIILETLGDVWNPGVDGDPRLTVLHTVLGGSVAGYFDSQNEFPRETHPNSNEREMLFMEGTLFVPGSKEYMAVLVHELQHAIHWAHDPGEDSWINEGMSEVAKEIAGYAPGFIEAFLVKPSTQLNFWEEGKDSPPHYGASTLFITYLMEHYGGTAGLQRLIDGAGDGVEGINDYLAAYSTTFDEVYADWIVANYLDAADWKYGYPNRQVQVRRFDRVNDFGERTGFLAPYSSRYFELHVGPGDVVLKFQGATTTRQVGTKCHGGDYCWWGNRGDSIDSTLTREFDLTELSKATLEFWTWFDIEEDWDYAYVEASIDGGQTWTILEGMHTTSENPVGNSYGDGFTGHSTSWVQEHVDLTPFAGDKVLVRFQYITDDAIYKDGIVIDDIVIPELGFLDNAEADKEWDAQGFERIDNVVPIEYVVQVIEQHSDGTHSVRRMSLDRDMRGKMQLSGLGGKVSGATVVVSPIAPDTHHLSRFTLGVGQEQ